MAVGGETIGRAYIKVLADGGEFEGDLRRVMKKAEPTAEKGGKDGAKAYNKGYDTEHEKGLRARVARLRAWVGLQGKEMSKLGDKTGKAFGKGARNDFVNIIGSLAGAMPKAIGALQQWVSGINKAGSASSEAAKKMTAAGGGVGGLGKAFGIIGQVVQAGFAIKAVTSGIGILGSAVSVTTGLVLALAGSLGFALVGGLVAVAGAAIPFAGAIGVAALAMGGINKKSKVFKDLAKDWKGLQKVATKAVFGKDMGGLSGLSNVLKAVKPVVKTVGESLGGLLDQLGKATGTKEFAKLMTQVGDAMGPMVTTLGKIGGNLLLGVTQAFIAAEPLINDFLGWLEDVSKSFVDMGKGGKKSDLADFFTKASESAAIVGPLILDIVDAIGILFSAGKKDGDSLFKSMAEQAEKLVTWLTSPEGQEALKTWFADARKFGEKLGEIVLSAIALVDALDTEENRAKLMLLLDAINWVIDAITWTITKWNEFKTAALQAIAWLPAYFRGLWATIQANFNLFIQTGLQHWGELVAGIQGFFAPIGAWFAGIWTAILGGISGFVTSGLAMFSQMGVGISTAWGAAVTFITSTLPGFVSGVISWFAQIPGRISAVLGDLAGRFQIWLAGVPQKIQSAVGLVAGAFSGLAGKAIARAGSIATAFTKWVATLPGKARTIATSAASGFVGLAAKIITKAGSLASRFASWVASLPGKARSIAASAANAFAGLAGKIIGKAGSIASRFASWVAGLPGKAKAIANSIANAFSGLANKAIAKAGSIVAAMGRWASGVAGRARGVANDIVDGFRGLAGRIINAIGTIIPKIKMPNIPRPTVQAIVKVVKPGASGFVTNGPEVRLIGEAGPEAVVPLNRALSRVDPAVRALSAFAQGIPQPGGGTTAPSIGRQIDVGGITINTPTTDPRAVASEVVNRLTFAAYI